MDRLKILLVNPYYRPVEFSLGLPIVESAFGAIPPINLLYVAAALRDAGADVALLDGEAQRLDEKQLAERIIALDADVVGFTSTTFSYHQVLDIARRIQDGCGSKVWIGGRHTAYYAETIAKEEAFDFVAIGEFEPVAHDFLRFLEGDLKREEMRGIAYRGDDGIVVNPPPGPVKDIDSFPFPARELLENSAYFSLLSKWRNFTLLLSSRGCPCDCIFCEVGRTAYRARSAENVVREMEEANSRFDIMEFDICDSDFCLDRERVLEIAGRIDGRYHFSGRARVNDLTPELVTKLARSGCFRIHLGVESGVPEVLEELHKQADLSRLPDVVRTANREGLAIVAYFMIGNPFETKEQARQTARFAKSLPFSFVQFTRTFPLPNSELNDRFIKSTGIDLWGDFYRTGKIGGFTHHLESELETDWVNSFINQSYLTAYLRPAAVFRVLFYFGPRRFFGVIGLSFLMVASWIRKILPRGDA